MAECIPVSLAGPLSGFQYHQTQCQVSPVQFLPCSLYVHISISLIVLLCFVSDPQILSLKLVLHLN